MNLKRGSFQSSFAARAVFVSFFFSLFQKQPAPVYCCISVPCSIKLRTLMPDPATKTSGSSSTTGKKRKEKSLYFFFRPNLDHHRPNYNPVLLQTPPSTQVHSCIYAQSITLNSSYLLLERQDLYVRGTSAKEILSACLSLRIHQCDPNSNHSNTVNHLWPRPAQPSSYRAQSKRERSQGLLR